MQTREAQLEPFLAYAAVECGLSEQTLDAYRRDLEKYAAYARRRGGNLGTVRSTDISGFVQRMTKKGCAGTTVNRRLSALRLYLKFQATDGKDTAGTLTRIEGPRNERPLPRVLGKSQTEQLVSAPTNLRDRAILETLWATGLRASELCGVRRADVDLGRGTIRVKGKGGKERLVHFDPKTAATLGEHLAQGEQAGDRRVFLSVTGKPLERCGLWHIVQRAHKASGLASPVTTHTLRHCFGSHLLSGGADLRVVQELMGHADVETTVVYTHLDYAHLKRMHSLHPRS